MDIKILDDIIYGRVIPHIYAFSTNTIPNYLKVGDTYRTVNSRLSEWKRYFPNLKKEFESESVINGNVYFRDYSLHKFLEHDKKRQKLMRSDVPADVYYSNEFFKDTKRKDIEEGILDINLDYSNKKFKYDFYDLMKKQQISQKYDRTESYPLRPNQKDVVRKFHKAYKAGRKNLLMYAVMRFGKSFTAMCCANDMKADIVVIVSGKADVMPEWKRTVESHINFKKYDFITAKELKRDPTSLSNVLNHRRKAVIFLTLQDLCGRTIKEKHKEIFRKKIDLLIVDETHFGAWADEYGKVLKDDEKDVNIKEYLDSYSIKEVEKESKYLDRDITLHLSGTPYRLLLDSEFRKEDIICFCQFSDIIKEQEAWDRKYLLQDTYLDGVKKGQEVKEWDNPYFGFPQMIRFAFNPNESAQKKLDEIKKNGYSFAFSKLLKPQSIEKDDDGKHKFFENEQQVLDLFKCIDGSKNDPNIFSFLNYDRIKKGSMCRHMVIVLPYCASCDALENLLISHKDEFYNLKDYEIINISGVDNIHKFRKVDDIINKISKFEEANKKTITLTVQRMLTGSTVKEWDTMIYLKDTSSPQEYDQAIFRLQNQYIQEIEDPVTHKTIKLNLKPQTLLVDFSPNRMFYMQEKKAQIYNANVDATGNSKLEERINTELKNSPIIVINKDKIIQVTETDILEAISNYNFDKGISEEVKEIALDLGILDNASVFNIIQSENEMSLKSGLKVKAGKGPETNLDADINSHGKENTASPDNGDESKSSKDDSVCDNDIKKMERKIQNYYRRILLFSFLTESKVNSLDKIISVIDKGDNIRIANNICLYKEDLMKLRSSFKNKFALSSLDYKIQDINKLSLNADKTGEEKINIAINKFGKLGDAIVITPIDTCNKMISLCDSSKLINLIKDNYLILDIASVAGEFAAAISEKLSKSGLSLEDYKKKIWSIPKTSICYELTRKVYKMIGLDINCISAFNSFDCLKIVDSKNKIDYKSIAKRIAIKRKFSNNDLSKEDSKMIKFGAVVGNPPYQEITSEKNTKNGQKPRKNIFHYFQLMADELKPNYSCLIYPGSRWIHRSGKGLDVFGENLINDEHLEKLLYFSNSKDVFKDADVSDGISIVFKDFSKHTKKFEYTYNMTQSLTVISPGKELMPLNPTDAAIIKKVSSFVQKNRLSYLNPNILSRSLFDIESDFVELNPSLVQLYDGKSNFNKAKKVKLFTNDKSGSAGRCKWYLIDRNYLESINRTNKKFLSEWQVVVSSAHPGGQDKRDNMLSVVDNYSAFGRARVALKSFSSKKEALIFYKYMKSKIIRFLLLMTDESLTSLAKYVPDFESYLDKTVINFDGDIDMELKEKINFSPEEIKYIESVLENS